MSWIVQSLLNNREIIREEADIDSDEFNDLLVVEKAIKELIEQSRLSADDLAILGIQEDDISSKLERHTLAKRKEQLCERIAYYLGDYFTDEGYLDEFAKKHRLSSEQVRSLWKYIHSNNKHKIIRKPINV